MRVGASNAVAALVATASLMVGDVATGATLHAVNAGRAGSGAAFEAIIPARPSTPIGSGIGGDLNGDTLFALSGFTTMATADDRRSFLRSSVWNPDAVRFPTLATDGDGASAGDSFTLNRAAMSAKVGGTADAGSTIESAFAPEAPLIPAVPEPSPAILLIASAGLWIVWLSVRIRNNAA